MSSFPVTSEANYDQLWYLTDFANVVTKTGKDHKFDFLTQEITVGEKKYKIPEYIEVFNIQAGFHKPRDMNQDIQKLSHPISTEKEFKRDVFIKLSVLITCVFITCIVVTSTMILIRYYGVI